jgi:hypothetical protein
VGRPGFGASVEVVATGKEEAIEKGRAEYPDWATAKDMTARPVRPYEEPAAGPQYEIFNLDTNRSIEEVPTGVGNDKDALTFLNDYIYHGLHSLPSGQARNTFGIRRQGDSEPILANPFNAGSTAQNTSSGRTATSPTGQWKIIDGLGRELFRFRPAFSNTRAVANELAALWARENNFDGNYQVEPAEETASTPAAGSTADLAQQRMVPGTFTGAWRVVDSDTGRELYRFSGIGNRQADANRVAADWLRQNGPEDANMTEIEVLPIVS